MTLTNTLVRPGTTRTRNEGRATPLAVFRELFGFDPFPDTWSMGLSTASRGPKAGTR